MDKGQKHGEAQREERIRQILDVTAALYDRDGYDAVTFSTIGRGLDFSRINLYNYFRSKEDIFLLILRRDIEAMVQDAAASFAAPESDIEAFAADWGALMMRHQRMMSLFGIVNTILLRGAGDEAHAAFRAAIYEKFLRLGAIVRRVLPWMDPPCAAAFVDFENSYAMTLYPASVEYKKVQGIAIFSDVGYGTRPFLPQYITYLTVILRGLHTKKGV